MDDILASIRRILSDEEKAASKGPSEGVLMLDPSMMVEDPGAPSPPAPPAPAPMQSLDTPAMTEIPANSRLAALAAETQADPDPALRPDFRHDGGSGKSSPGLDYGVGYDPSAHDSLTAPSVAAAASASVGTLMRTLVAERNSVVHRGGPSIEDLVREEIRPLLKDWLDVHLPGLVERLVRAEIERVVGRITG